MPILSPRNISGEDAQSFRAAVEAREATRLAELSHWMRSTGGPWDALDGSLDSLVPLWQWFIEFTREGHPGIPDTAAGQWFVKGDDEEAVYSKPAYAAEAVAHYVMLVCRRADPGASWAVETRKNATFFQETGIRFSDGRVFDPTGPVVLSANRALNPPPRRKTNEAASPDRLRTLVEEVLPRGAQKDQERSGPVLPPPQATPDPPRIWWRPASMVTAGTVPSVTQASPSSEGAQGELADLLEGGEMITLVHAEGELSGPPEQLPPLDHALIVAHLEQAGFYRTAPGQGQEVWEFDCETMHVSAYIVLADGEARLINVSFEGDLTSSSPDSRSTAAVFTTLAERLGARIASEFDEE
jgi:hypothetical protein